MAETNSGDGESGQGGQGTGSHTSAVKSNPTETAQLSAKPASAILSSPTTIVQNTEKK